MEPPSPLPTVKVQDKGTFLPACRTQLLEWSHAECIHYNFCYLQGASPANIKITPLNPCYMNGLLLSLLNHVNFTKQQMLLSSACLRYSQLIYAGAGKLQRDFLCAHNAGFRKSKDRTSLQQSAQ